MYAPSLNGATQILWAAPTERGLQTPNSSFSKSSKKKAQKEYLWSSETATQPMKLGFSRALHRSHASAVKCWRKGQDREPKALAVAMAASNRTGKVSRCRSVWRVCAVTCCLCLPHAEWRQIQSVFQLPQSVCIKMIWWNSGGASEMSSLTWVFKLVCNKEGSALSSPAWAGNTA